MHRASAVRIRLVALAVLLAASTEAGLVRVFEKSEKE